MEMAATTACSADTSIATDYLLHARELSFQHPVPARSDDPSTHQPGIAESDRMLWIILIEA